LEKLLKHINDFVIINYTKNVKDIRIFVKLN